MLKILRNNLYFRNVTCHWNYHSNLCLACTKKAENKMYFIHCDVHLAIMKEIFDQMTKAYI